MGKYKLSPAIKFGKLENSLQIGISKNQLTITNELQQKCFLALCDYLLTPRTTDEIKNFLQIKTELNIDETLTTLSKKRLIVDASFDTEEKFNSRDWLFYNLYADPLEIQAELSAKHVAVVGCGGVGAHVATMLRQSGIGKLTLIDDDRISISNLSRQMIFQNKDLNKLKIESLHH